MSLTLTNLELMKYFLGIEVEQSNHGICISQQKCSTDILKNFKMKKCKPVDTPSWHKVKQGRFGVNS